MCQHLCFRAARKPHQACGRAQQHLRGGGEGAHQEDRDKSRASYYNYYSSKDWGEAKSYDLCIDSSLLGIEGTVALLEEMVKLKGMK